MAREDDLHAIKYLPLKLKGPAQHWLNSLPENSIGSLEDLEDAFRDNFQGTYVRPPDADDLSHIIQQPGESSMRFWTRFLVKKNQIIDCPDAEALAAFKHTVRDEWLARHLGQEKPKSISVTPRIRCARCLPVIRRHFHVICLRVAFFHVFMCISFCIRVRFMRLSIFPVVRFAFRHSYVLWRPL